LLAGADVVMTTAAILRHGPEYVQTLLAGLETWLEIRQVESLDCIRGQMSWARAKKNESYMRVNYMHLIETFARAHRR
jgi:dihydroorotate dehydrogenase (fumarate)